MPPKAQHISVVAGLDILLGELRDRGPLPTATIRFRAWNHVESVLEEPCVLKMWVSAIRLRAILGKTALTENLLTSSSVDKDVHIPVSNAAIVRRIVDDIRVCPYEGAARALFLQGKLLELLIEGISSPAMSETERIAYEVRRILLADPMNPPSQDEIARIIGVKARRVEDCFRETFDTTIFKWLTDWRLVRARDLVVEGELPITHISASLGYRHLPTFVSAFTRRFGVSPRRLRGEVQDESSGTISGSKG